MSDRTQDNNGALVERQIMIAVDASANSKRAVQFVGDFFGCYPAIRVILLTIILEPSPGYFINDQEQEKWLKEQQLQAERMMEAYKGLLVDSGFSPDKVETKIICEQAPSIADCILEAQEKLKCCTMVIGRRGISKKEEFIFGSTSNKILHEATNCAVLVIE
jgi:nucleotide-binding universal stress UspA family protein